MANPEAPVGQGTVVVGPPPEALDAPGSEQTEEAPAATS